MSAVDPRIRDMVEAHGQAVADGAMRLTLEDLTGRVPASPTLSSGVPGR